MGFFFPWCSLSEHFSLSCSICVTNYYGETLSIFYYYDFYFFGKGSAIHTLPVHGISVSLEIHYRRGLIAQLPSSLWYSCMTWRGTCSKPGDQPGAGWTHDTVQRENYEQLLPTTWGGGPGAIALQLLLLYSRGIKVMSIFNASWKNPQVFLSSSWNAADVFSNWRSVSAA